MLDTKIPPPVVAIAAAIAMWALARTAPASGANDGLRLFATSLGALLGLAFVAAGYLALRRAKTTANPVKPESVSALVTSGVYRLTRNPMYVSLVLLLLAYGTYLWSLPAFLGPIAFVAYITRFQIIPEERVLEERFGNEFAEYRRRVRRWI